MTRTFTGRLAPRPASSQCVRSRLSAPSLAFAGRLVPRLPATWSWPTSISIARCMLMTGASRLSQMASHCGTARSSLSMRRLSPLVSPITRAGEPQTRADVEPGRAVSSAAERKRRYDPELTRARRCRLVVVGHGVGGRFATEAATFLRFLARHRAAAMPAWLRPAAQSAWVSRWAALLAIAAQRAYASSLRAPARRRGQRRGYCAGAS